MRLAHGLSLAALLTVHAMLPGQDFAGQLLATAFNPGPWHPRTGTGGGLYLVHPRSGACTQASGLPLEMTGAVGPTNFDVGLDSLLLLPNGDLLVGEVTPPTGTVAGVDNIVEVHQLRLASQTPGSWTATVVRTYPIGNVQGSSGSVESAAIDWLPNGNVLLVLNGNLAPPMNGIRLAELDLGTSAVTPWTLNGFPAVSLVNAMAISQTQGILYLGEFSSTGLGSVWSGPLPPLTGPRVVTVTRLSTAPTMGGCMSLDLDNQGQIIVGTNGANGVQAAAPSLHRVNPRTGAVTNLVPALGGVRNAILVESNTDAPLRESVFCAGARLDFVQAGTSVTLVAGTTAPWGIVSGLEMLPAVWTSGVASTCASSGPHTWSTTPNPGGIPLIGNAGFMIAIQNPGPEQVCAFAIGAGVVATPRLALPYCAQFLLDPAKAWFTAALSSPTPVLTFPISLPVPNLSTLAGVSVYAQSFHPIGNVLESSAPLRLTIL